MFALIGRLNAEGLAILLVEQNVVQSLAVAPAPTSWKSGKVALSGKASELAEHPGLRKSYLGH
jgi:branched-chain amino acid transport system ATP-binding protein